jgi:predicted RNA-binding protein associated with RNAse of E/G family
MEPPEGDGARRTLPEVRIHYLRPPDRLDVFRQSLLHDDGSTLVTLAEQVELERPVMVEGSVALETGASAIWFTFPGCWHDIGLFHRADGTFTGIYANILTPPEILPGHVWKTTDLFLDVWVPPEGGLVVLDREQLAEAVGRGWVDGETAARAEEEVDRIVDGYRSGAWPPAIVGEWPLARAQRER